MGYLGRRTKSSLVFVLVTAAAWTSACGSNGGGTSHAELVADGNKICASNDAALGKLFGTLFANGDEEPPAAKAAPILADAVKVADGEAVAFGALHARKADRDVVDRVHNAFARVATLGRNASELASKGDQRYLAALAKTNDAATGAHQLAVKAGFDRCAPV